jgi:hypothetical protein
VAFVIRSRSALRSRSCFFLKPASNRFTLVAIHLVSLLFVSLAIYGWRVGHPEERARELITGAELQAWAANLMLQYPTNAGFSISELGTNLPPQLLGLDCDYPNITITRGPIASSDQVVLRWRRYGFDIGSTNFVSRSYNARFWQPGVYFWIAPD